MPTQADRQTDTGKGAGGREGPEISGKLRKEAASEREEKAAPDRVQQRVAVEQKKKGAERAVLQAAADSGESCPIFFSTRSPQQSQFQSQTFPLSPNAPPWRALSHGWGHPKPSHQQEVSLITAFLCSFPL